MENRPHWQPRDRVGAPGEQGVATVGVAGVGLSLVGAAADGQGALVQHDREFRRVLRACSPR